MDKQYIKDFIKARLIGLFLIFAGVAMIAIERDATIALFTVPAGLALVFMPIGGPKDETKDQ